MVVCNCRQNWTNMNRRKLARSTGWAPQTDVLTFGIKYSFVLVWSIRSFRSWFCKIPVGSGKYFCLIMSVSSNFWEMITHLYWPTNNIWVHIKNRFVSLFSPLMIWRPTYTRWGSSPMRRNILFIRKIALRLALFHVMTSLFEHSNLD